ncbi:glutamate--tRNA ligase [Patescibacteria group bacterium]
MKNVRVRFAPSPTGFLHIGGLRTALFNYLFAKKNGGTFIVRIEDTDKTREVQGALKNILEALTWYGLTWDEGPSFSNLKDSLGNHGPYIQSQRKAIYFDHAMNLIESGKAYKCFCSPERLEKVRNEQSKRKEASRYDQRCRGLDENEINKYEDEKKEFVIRLKVPEEGSTSFKDLIRGNVEFENIRIDDQVLLKSDGFPTYHLANVVDDHLMEISHVIRAEEWLSSTPKHILIYKAFGWEIPEFAHLPMILGSDRAKLSKRHGAEAALDYRDHGFLPGAVLNYIAFLGWNPGDEREIFSLSELEREFSFKNVNKAASIFDIQKLTSVNAQHIRTIDEKILIEQSRKFITIAEVSDEKLELVIKSIKDRIETLKEIEEWASYFFEKSITYDAKILIPKKETDETTYNALTIALDILLKIPKNDFKEDILRKNFIQIIQNNKMTNSQVLWPLRVAISGKKASPDVFSMMAVLGLSISVQRVKKALVLIKGLKKG